MYVIPEQLINFALEEPHFRNFSAFSCNPVNANADFALDFIVQYQVISNTVDIAQI